MSAPAPAVSVVVPVYNEAGNVAPLFADIREVLLALGRPFEVIYVNDGSTDTTLVELRRLAGAEPCLRILDLDGNFGEAAALSAGFRAARGDLVVTLDGDGQNDPHDIPYLLELLEQRNYRVVSGWRRERQEGFWLRVLPSRLANRLIAMISGVPVHDTGCGLKIYRRSVVADAALPRGMNRFLPAILGVSAAEVGEIAVHDRRRQHGRSHYGISRTFAVLRDLAVLPFLQANLRRHQTAWALVGSGAAVVATCGILSSGGLLAFLGAIVLAPAAAIWWNLRRFNHARRHGVYRLRREYFSTRGIAA